MRKYRVLLIGPYPPPIGGVSIHLKRFLELSKSSDIYNCAVLDIKKLTVHGDKSGGVFRSLSAFINADIIHIHMSSNTKRWVALAAKILGKKVVYTHHNSRISNKSAFKYLYDKVDRLILVNDRTIDPGFTLSEEKTNVIPAFLPPSQPEDLDPELKNALQGKEFVVSANCSHKADFEGKDLYGFDILISAFSKFCSENPDKNALLVLVDPSGTSKEFVNECLVKTPIPKSRMIFWTKPTDFFTLVNCSDVVIRSARTDGDSLTVREALYCGTHILASDCTWRPKGTILYKTEDSRDLFEQLKVIAKGEMQAYKEQSDYYKDIIAQYNDVLKNS